jgi:hypothetical protein
MPDEVARIGALSNGSNGQRSLESASLHFEAIWRRERGNAERESPAEILSERSESKDPPGFSHFCARDPELAEGGKLERESAKS